MTADQHCQQAPLSPDGLLLENRIVIVGEGNGHKVKFVVERCIN